jgi:Resolvase, N terminal domain
MTGQRVGYVRVSSLDQNPDRQLDGVQLDRTFTDQASGRDVHRPKLAELLRFVRDGDTVVVHSLDRLGRNLDDLRRLVGEADRPRRPGGVRQGAAGVLRRGLADGPPAAVGDGGVRRVRAGIDPRASSGPGEVDTQRLASLAHRHPLVPEARWLRARQGILP